MPAFQSLLKDCEAEVRAAASGKVKGMLNNFKCSGVVVVGRVIWFLNVGGGGGGGGGGR